MSFTQAYHVFGGFSERGFGSVLKALHIARPRYFHYATPGIAPHDTVVVTQIPVGPFGLEYSLEFDLPTIDITPADAGDVLPPGKNQFTLITAVNVTVVAQGRSESSKLGIFVECHPSIRGAIATFSLDQLKISGITPSALEVVLETIVAGFARQLLSNVQIPVSAFVVPPVILSIQAGPLAENDLLDVRGDLL